MKSYIYLILLILFFPSCKQGAEQQGGVQDEPSAAGPVARIAVAPVERRDMTDTLHIFGEVALRQEVELASQFDGRLEGFTLLMGDRVKKGEQLGVIIPPMREALLQVLDQIPPEQRSQIAGEIKEIPLYSPMEGVVLAVYRHAGDVLQKGEAIVHIGQLHTLDVHGDLPVSLLDRVKQLRRIQVDFVNYHHPSMMLPVIVIGGKVDASRQTVPVRLRLDNPAGEFRPGMMVRLTFPGAYHPNTLVVPRKALLEEEGVFSVFVLRKDHTVEKRYVTPGIRHDDLVEIVTGLKEGEQVAVTRTYSLTDGMEVTVQ